MQGAMFELKALRQTLDVARLAYGFRPEAMIDGNGEKTRTARKRAPPTRHQPHQRDRVRAAGNREHERGRPLPVREQAFGVIDRDRGMVVV